MTTPLRTRLDELDVCVTRVAEATGIPPAHLEKDFWVTEVLRGASNASEATGYAATEGDAQRRVATARHYYDVDRLLRDDGVLSDLQSNPIDLLAREVTEHSRAAGLPTAARPPDGFTASPAWDPSATNSANAAYSAAMDELLWPDAPRSSFTECCHRVHELAELL